MKRELEIKNGVLKKYNGNGGHVTIPDCVTIIGEKAFNGCTEFVQVTIPDSVTEIIGCPFSGCTKLTSVTLPGSVKKSEKARSKTARILP